jgi:hypothetical protein
MAPGASIMLVEASSAGDQDLTVTRRFLFRNPANFSTLRDGDVKGSTRFLKDSRHDPTNLIRPLRAGTGIENDFDRARHRKKGIFPA